MRGHAVLLAALLLFSLCTSASSQGRAASPASPRLLFVTLIPDFETNRIRFDAQAAGEAASASPDLTGLPLNVDQSWQDANSMWNIRGTVAGGRLEFVGDENLYRLSIGPILLRPQDDLKWIFPFVNLDYSQIQPAPDAPDKDDLESRERTHRFTFRGGQTGREIETLDIPFRLITRKIELTLTPLVGEVLIEEKQGFRLSGSIVFGSISDFDEFSRHCQSAANQILHGDDYRSAHLLYTLDQPHYFGPDVLNPTYQSKPTTVQLHSELASCQYKPAEELGEVQAVFSGRSHSIDPDPSLFPAEWKALDSPDGNYPFAPERRHSGVRGYIIRLGRIVLAPGDTLTLTVPHTAVQVDSLSPVPDHLIYLEGRTQIVYTGPASFELSLPYVAQSDLYLVQFPSFLRPAVSVLEEQLKPFLPFVRPWLAWLILGAGVLLLLLWGIVGQSQWLVIAGWLLLGISFFYGVRGSFGLLCVAIAIYLSGWGWPRSAARDGKGAAQKIGFALISFGLIALGVYFDAEGNAIFQGLSEPDLSPLTPIVLLLLCSALMVVLSLYKKSREETALTLSNLPALVILLSVLILYDAFDKSLIALLILSAGILYVMKAASTVQTGSEQVDEARQFGVRLMERLQLAFGNRIVPAAIVVLILFALVNDLSSAYANELQIRIAPLLTPIAIPLLAFASVFVAFTSIALLFVLIYPFLPSRSGYLKAIFFAVFLFFVFSFGIGTDDRLIASLPNILIGRVIYYFSVPLFIGIYMDINEFMQNENKRISAEGGEKKSISFRDASGIYLKNLRSIAGTLIGIATLVVPSIYAFASSQPALVTYFQLLEKLVLLPT